MDGQTCETCRFWVHLEPLEEQAGKCRRRAPQPGLIDLDNGLPGLLRADWPKTVNDDWCGEWRAKLDPPREVEPITWDSDFSVRVLNIFDRVGIRTFNDLADNWTAKDLLLLHNFGETSLAEVREVLARRGYSLRGDPPPVSSPGGG